MCVIICLNNINFQDKKLIDDYYDGSKLFTTIPGACKVILGWTHPDRHDVIDFLVERNNYLQDQA